jgi:signal transduction histidine kinase/DNA-binding response OmpR family regulator
MKLLSQRLPKREPAEKCSCFTWFRKSSDLTTTLHFVQGGSVLIEIQLIRAIIINMSTSVRDRILIVENDPVISDLVARQALQAAGYQTYVVPDAASAISRAIQVAPDVIVMDLSVPGLSAKDLMVVLSSQNIDTPVIILGQKGKEKDIIQAFRLGASDYMIWPTREAEVVNVVERSLKMVHERRERDRLAKQLQQTNQDLQSRVRELTTIFSIGKAVTSVTDRRLLLDKILDGAIKVTRGDLGWFSLRTGSKEKSFIMVANSNLPPSLVEFMNQPWDDGISSLVAMSGEPLSISGEPLKRFKIISLGSSALIMPVKAQKEVIGLLIILRKQDVPFTNSEQRLLEAVADYASISLVNLQLFRTVEERAHLLQRSADEAQLGEKVGGDLLLQVKQELREPLDASQTALEKLTKDPTARWTADQRQSLTTFSEQLNYLNRVVDSVPALDEFIEPTEERSQANEVLLKAVPRFQHFAQPANISLVAEIPSDRIEVGISAGQLSLVVDALLSNAVKFCNPGGRVTLRLEIRPDHTAQITVADSGSGIESRQVDAVFKRRTISSHIRPRRFGGLGIRLYLVKEIVAKGQGKIWVESKPGQGSSFYVTFPMIN